MPNLSCPKIGWERSSTGRKRQRPSLQVHRMLVLALVLISTSDAFVIGFGRQTARNQLYQVKRTRRTDTRPTRKYEDDDDDDESSGWISWMQTGRKTNAMIYRKPEELGGIVRQDRYSSSDWFHNTITLPNSAILRAIRVPVFFMTSWATLLSFMHHRLLKSNPAAAELMCIPSTPHSLMVSALSLLLVFKTNSAYQRFAEGRKIWETIINNSRDLYRMMNLYEKEIGKGKYRRLQRLLAAFPYFLRHRIRPNLVMYRLDDAENVRDPEHSIVLYQDKAVDDLDPESAAVAAQEESEGKSRRKTRTLYWVDRRTLPWRLLPSPALEPCARAQNRPLWVCDRMAQELRNVPDGPNFSARERLTLIARVEKLSGCLGACERIHQTAVPLNYARHSLRALTLWLFTLPFALVGSLKAVTGPVVFLISWLLFGVYEIGYSIEDPFQGTLRLSVLCDLIRRDVLADEMIRNTAFQIPSDDVVEKNTLETESDYEYSSISKEEKVGGADSTEKEGEVNGQSNQKDMGSENRNRVDQENGNSDSFEKESPVFEKPEERMVEELTELPSKNAAFPKGKQCPKTGENPDVIERTFFLVWLQPQPYGWRQGSLSHVPTEAAGEAATTDVLFQASMSRFRLKASSYLCFLLGWMSCWVLLINRSQLQQMDEGSAYGLNHYSTRDKPFEAHFNSSSVSLRVGELLARRPNWRKDYEMWDWLPKWLEVKEVDRWKLLLQDPQKVAYTQNFPQSRHDEEERDSYFWNQIISSERFTFANANIGLGHRLAQLSYSYTCQIIPQRQQQLIHWVTGGIDDNRGWHHLFRDSPVLAGVPPHWTKGAPSMDRFQAYRNATGAPLVACGDFSTYFPLGCDKGGGMCQGFKHPRDLWFLRFAKEPSAQEFYQLLRAQTHPRIKEKVATFMDDFWPSKKLVIGVHIRAGNGKDDGLGHFDLVKRGDWLAKDLPGAVKMVRQHVRFVAHSIIDRYNMGGSFSKYEVDNYYQIFLATDTHTVLEEFQKQDPTVFSLSQPRPKDGVAIFQSAACENGEDNVQCALQTQESMLVDALLLSSTDVILAESFSNFIYSMPATLALAEGRIFCEAGRAALGGRYITQNDQQASLMGEPGWWANPPPNVMPVRCQTSAWAARDRSDLHSFPDIMA
eukprot:scaffold23471_cov141-Cylindrotheca_fusiformis.AAC.16